MKKLIIVLIALVLVGCEYADRQMPRSNSEFTEALNQLHNLSRTLEPQIAETDYYEEVYYLYLVEDGEEPRDPAGAWLGEYVVTENIILPIENKYDYIVKWRSSNESVISSTGEVTRQAVSSPAAEPIFADGAPDTIVYLTAHIQERPPWGLAKSATFRVRVKALE